MAEVIMKITPKSVLFIMFDFQVYYVGDLIIILISN